MRENFVPPLYGTDRLHVKIQNELKYSVVDIVDSLLWIYPQMDTLSFHQAELKTLKVNFFPCLRVFWLCV